MSLHRRNLLLLQRLLRNKLLQSRPYLKSLPRSNHQRSSCKPVCFRSFQLSQQSPTQWRPLRPTPRQSPKSHQRRRVLRNQKFQRQRWARLAIVGRPLSHEHVQIEGSIFLIVIKPFSPLLKHYIQLHLELHIHSLSSLPYHTNVDSSDLEHSTVASMINHQVSSYSFSFFIWGFLGFWVVGLWEFLKTPKPQVPENPKCNHSNVNKIIWWNMQGPSRFCIFQIFQKCLSTDLQGLSCKMHFQHFSLTSEYFQVCL